MVTVLFEHISAQTCRRLGFPVEIITIACALHCSVMQENTELTAYAMDSIR